MLHQKIDKDLFDFLLQLKNNNNKEWFTAHKSIYTAQRQNFKAFMEGLMEAMRGHDEIEQLKLFRIYRDVRFSNDKTPYKNTFSGYFTRAGQQRRGGYYVHIEPGASFLGAGFWQPEKEDLLRIRKEWEIDANELRAIMANSTFKDTWGDLYGDELKTAPKGFDKDHPNIDLIRKKQFVFVKKFTDKEVMDADFLPSVNNAFRTIRPFFDLMSHVLTTDLNGESLIE